MLIRSRGVCLGVLAAAALTAAVNARAAPAEPDKGSPHVVTQPDWVRLPDADSLTRNYPKRASDEGVPGRALIRCRVAADGSLDPCGVVSESPPGYGFGEAAVRLSHDFKMRPQTVDGEPVASGVVNIPIRFILPPRPPPLDWRSVDRVLTLQFLTAVAGLAFAVTGFCGLAFAQRGAGAQLHSSIVEAPPHQIWPWLCLGLGLAGVAAVAPSLLHHAGGWSALAASHQLPDARAH